MSIQREVFSPIATGGSGTLFEQHVDALFLAIMLVRGIPPILKDCQLEEVHLQAGHLGWNTDDLLIIGTRGSGGRRHLAAQIKSRFTISAANDDCRAAFTGFWNDFKHNSNFDPDRDRLALVTLRGTDTLLNTFNSLLDCARASADEADFVHRLKATGYLSKKAQEQAAAIRTIILQAEGREPDDSDYWRFLRVLHVVSFDLNTSSAQTEAWIKNLLAHTSREPDPVAAAETTWRELLELVGAGMPTATSYTYANLPEALRNRHGAIAFGGVLGTLVAHSQTTLNGICTTIAHAVRISRDALVARMLEGLDQSQVVVLTGPAGFGKSALARSAIELLHGDLFCLAFRAEEFATSHIDQTLQQAQASINAERLLALLAAQGCKVILVESVERLLEASVRNAFSDLLRLATQDRSIRLLLTCRDYSVNTVRASLLERAGLPHSVIEVPPLTDDELDQVVKVVPSLKGALGSDSLRKLLRSPYLLDRAAQMDWSDPQTLPADERTFRSRCWHEVVRNDAAAGGGMPRRREQVFLELAVRRARALSPYVQCDGLDAEALEALRRDDLVVFSKETGFLAAPAHDVLEDWAIIQWFGGQFSLHEQEAAALVTDIGGYPAIRRGYRKWLGEMLECETQRADAFVISSFSDDSLPAYFRDDTLVSVLLSSSAAGFLARQRKPLLADQGRLLVRVIHLLRVACKASPRWLSGATTLPSQLLVPRGEAWPAVLEIVIEGLGQLLPAHLGLLVGLLEDWAGSIEWNAPDPPGFHEAGKIAFALLAHLDGYRMDDLRKRVLTMISKIPRADAVAFQDLLERGCSLDRHDRVASDFAEILLPGFNSAFACRDFPEHMVRLTTAHFCLSDQDLQSGCGYHSSADIEPFFGIRDHTHLDFFPASAIRGPFLPLLRSYPEIGLKLVINLLNRAGTWYGEQRWPYDRLEPAWQITLDVPGEGQVTQWANPRLWCLYRGLSVGPYILQTALMALESWLLGICQLEGFDMEPLLLRLLRESNNAAVTSVVASVCNAYPEKGGRAALALLSSQDLIEMDRGRVVQEYASTSSGFLSLHNAETRIYEEERKESAALPQRRHDLEALTVKLQLGGWRERVWEILDRYRAALPPVEEQSDKHRIWRLALHRMDVRGYRPVELPTDSDARGTEPQEAAPEQRAVHYGPGAIEEDVQAIVDRHAPVRARQEADLGLLLWGRSAWDLDESRGVDITAWQARLSEAQEREREPGEAEEFTRGGPSFVAAVCVRDHWDEMRSQDREWCVTKLINEIERDCESDDDMGWHVGGFMRPDRAAAYVLPRVLSQTPPGNSDPRLRRTLARALTHAGSEVMAYAAEGIGYYLQGDWHDFVMQCVGAVARQARLIAEREAAERAKPYGERRWSSALVQSVVPEVRACIEGGKLDAEAELTNLDLGGWTGRQAAQTIFQIFGYPPHASPALAFHRRVLEFLVERWAAEQRDRELRGHRDYEFEYESSERVARFVMKLCTSEALTLCEPMLSAVGEHPDEVARFIKSLVLAENRSEGETPFWEIWQAFADRLCGAPWVEQLDSRHATGAELLSKIFLGLPWEEGVHHWRRLEGQASRIDALVKRIPDSAAVLRAYCRFLYDIGEQSLPNGFVVVAERFSAGNMSEMLAADSTVFYLESLLRKYVYGEPLRLKENPRVRSAVLCILDDLVEAGSSAAFRMRDDFVTPVGGRS